MKRCHFSIAILLTFKKTENDPSICNIIFQYGQHGKVCKSIEIAEIGKWISSSFYNTSPNAIKSYLGLKLGVFLTKKNDLF